MDEHKAEFVEPELVRHQEKALGYHRRAIGSGDFDDASVDGTF
jgi:hypothetical protein